MGRVYTASIETASTSAAKTLAYITVPADSVVLLMSAEVVAPDDDTNEQLDICWQKITTLGTPTGTSVTPSKHSTGDAAAGSTVVMDVTASEPTYGAANVNVIGHFGASSLGGYRYEPAIDERPEFSPSENWGLRLLTAPGTAKTLTVCFTFMELGG